MYLLTQILFYCGLYILTIGTAVNGEIFRLVPKEFAIKYRGSEHCMLFFFKTTQSAHVTEVPYSEDKI